MTEYWKSNPKYFCETCKCWMQDNRASREFHDRGDRHQQNVKRRISDCQKNAIERDKEKKHVAATLMGMEKAALSAFKRDMLDNPDAAKKYGKVETQYLELYEGAFEEPPEKKAFISEAGMWYEAKSEDDKTYYWNDETKETQWVTPPSYVSLAEQKRQKEQRAFEKKIRKEIVEMREQQGTGSFNEATSANDLQLPTNNWHLNTGEEVSNWKALEPEEEVIEFAEKKHTASVSNAGAEAPTFKKRKAPKSLRQKDGST